MSESRLMPTLARPGGLPATAASSLSEHAALARTRLRAAVYDDGAGAADGLASRASRRRRHASRHIPCSRS